MYVSIKKIIVLRNKMDTTHLEPLNTISQHLSFVGGNKTEIDLKDRSHAKSRFHIPTCINT